MYAALSNTLRRIDRRHSRRLHRAQRFRRDRIDISAAAAYRFAAREFDPHRITRAETKTLTELLFGTGAIRAREPRAMRRMVGRLSRSPVAFGDKTSCIDLIRTLDEIYSSADKPAPHTDDLAKTLAILRLVACRRP